MEKKIQVYIQILIIELFEITEMEQLNQWTENADTDIDDECEMCEEDDDTCCEPDKSCCLLCGNEYYESKGIEFHDDEGELIMYCDECIKKYDMGPCEQCGYYCAEIDDIGNREDIRQGNTAYGYWMCIKCYVKYKMCGECGIEFREDRGEGIVDAYELCYCMRCIEEEDMRECSSCGVVYRCEELEECPYCES